MGTAILLPNYYVPLVTSFLLLLAMLVHNQASPLPGQDLTPEDMLETRRERDVDNYHYVYQDNVWYLEPEDMRRKREGVDSLPLKTKRDDEARLVEGHHGWADMHEHHAYDDWFNYYDSNYDC